MYSQLLFPTISELSYKILIIIQVKAKIKNWTIFSSVFNFRQMAMEEYCFKAETQK